MGFMSKVTGQSKGYQKLFGPGAKDPNAEAANATEATKQRLQAEGNPIGFNSGLKKGTELADVMLGKTGRDQMKAERSTEITDILNRRRDQLGGINADENAALRQENNNTVQNLTNANMRSLRGSLASSGVRGGAAFNAQAGVLNEGANRAAANDRDMMIKNIEMKRSALDNYEKSVTGQEGVERGLLTDQLKVMLGGADMGQQNSAQITQAGSNAAAAASAENGQKKGGGLGGSSVICSVLAAQNLIPAHIWAADEEFGKRFAGQDLMRGYHSWAVPVASVMERSPLLTKILQPFGSAWAHYIAFLMGVHPKPNRLGRFLFNVGAPICRFVGRVI